MLILLTNFCQHHKFCTSDRVESVEAVGEGEDVLLRDQGAHALVSLPAMEDANTVSILLSPFAHTVPFSYIDAG